MSAQPNIKAKLTSSEMTPTKQWSEMTAEERDRLVSTKVMGWPDRMIPARYTQDIHCAFQVIEKTRKEGWHLSLEYLGDTEQTLRCFFWRDEDGESVSYDAEAKHPAEAICLAALRAKGVEV